MCGPWTVFFPQRSLHAEIRTKDTDSQEIVFAGASDLVTAANRPSVNSDFPISASTTALIVPLDRKRLMNIPKAKIITEELEPISQGFV